MNLNEAYALFRNDPKVAENKDIFGEELLKYCRKFTRKKSKDAADITSESSWHSTEDASSDSILAVWDNLHKYIPNEHATFATWVRKIIENHLNKAYRAHKNHAQTLPTDEMLQHSPHVGLNAKLSLKKLLSQLSDEDKTFVQMKLDGYSEEEIGQKYNRDAGWANDKFTYLKKKLRQTVFSG